MWWWLHTSDKILKIIKLYTSNMWIICYVRAYPMVQMIKKSACSVEDLGSIPALWGSTREGNGYCSSILAWRIPWTEDPSKFQFTGWQRVRHNWVTNTHTHTHTYTYMLCELYINKALLKKRKLFENYCQQWKFLYLLPLRFFIPS